MVFLEEILRTSEVSNKKALAVFVGAGGKTSGMFAIANELKKLGKRVLITTTTKMYRPDQTDYDHLLLGDKQELLSLSSPSEPTHYPGEIIVWGKDGNTEGKILGVKPKEIDDLWLKGSFSWILVEGDGAKRKNLKAPKIGEPVIPSQSTHCLGVIGMNGLKAPVSEKGIHRLQEFIKVTELEKGKPITIEHLRRLILHPNGLFKSCPVKAEKIAILNQSEEKEVRKEATRLAASLPMTCMITSFKEQKLFLWKKSAGNSYKDIL